MSNSEIKLFINTKEAQALMERACVPKDMVKNMTVEEENFTVLSHYRKEVKRLTKPMKDDAYDIFHALLGMGSEVGELQDAYKSYLVYGKAEDRVNIVEEAGDLLFFMQMLLNKLGYPLEMIIEANLAKLNTRYIEGYNDKSALNRKKDLERLQIEEVMQLWGAKEL